MYTGALRMPRNQYAKKCKDESRKCCAMVAPTQKRLTRRHWQCMSHSCKVAQHSIGETVTMLALYLALWSTETMSLSQPEWVALGANMSVSAALRYILQKIAANVLPQPGGCKAQNLVCASNSCLNIHSYSDCSCCTLSFATKHTCVIGRIRRV